MAGSPSLRNVPSGVYPLFVVMAGAVVGATYFVYHKTTGPDVILAKRTNPTPWNNVQQHENTKLYDHSGYFKSRWSRFSSQKAPESQ
ncbi:hypothetical protein HDU87_002578 [Geranomyces variabilis]|uniref:Uncharacterized protein n=1 Tax=Geranomyces variabilis TaxID=109894 RepID=A0AAD5TRE4_9FUNG|nr:hypothetical protein HDU87_002578 [Geranomyces variabilis]